MPYSLDISVPAMLSTWTAYYPPTPTAAVLQASVVEYSDVSTNFKQVVRVQKLGTVLEVKSDGKSRNDNNREYAAQQITCPGYVDGGWQNNSRFLPSMMLGVYRYTDGFSYSMSWYDSTGFENTYTHTDLQVPYPESGLSVLYCTPVIVPNTTSSPFRYRMWWMFSPYEDFSADIHPLYVPAAFQKMETYLYTGLDFGVIAPKVTGVTLSQTAVSLNRGESVQFTATVTGEGSFDPSVTWSMSGQSPNGGTTLSTAGKLTIGENETAASITVTATSVGNGARAASAAVTVADHISKLKISGDAQTIMTWNASNGYLETAAVDEETGYKLFDRYLTAEELEGGSLTLSAAEGTETIPLTGNVEELAPGAVIFLQMALSLTDEMAAFLGLPSGGIWVTTDLTALGVDSAALAYGNGIAATATTAKIVFTCADLLETAYVYRVKAWVYDPAAGLDTTLPATWSSELFGGPTHSEAHTFTGLSPNTAYEVYAVIWVETAWTASDQNAAAAFATLEEEALTAALDVTVDGITGSGATLHIALSGLEAGVPYDVEVNVYSQDPSTLAFEKVLHVTGSGTKDCALTGLQPDTAYLATVYVYPSATGEVAVYGEYGFETLSRSGWGVYAGVGGAARQVREVYVGVNGKARRVTGVYVGRGGKAEPVSGS